MSDIYKTIVLGGLNALIFLAQWYWAKYTEVSFVLCLGWYIRQEASGRGHHHLMTDSTDTYAYIPVELIVKVHIVTNEEFSVMTGTIILNDCSIIICHISLHLDSPSLFPLVLSLLLCRH